MDKKRIILDCDPGHDDAVAMFMVNQVSMVPCSMN